MALYIVAEVQSKIDSNLKPLRYQPSIAPTTFTAHSYTQSLPLIRKISSTATWLCLVTCCAILISNCLDCLTYSPNILRSSYIIGTFPYTTVCLKPLPLMPFHPRPFIHLLLSFFVLAHRLHGPNDDHHLLFFRIQYRARGEWENFILHVPLHAFCL